jgi:hypothetical protein
MTRCTGSHLSAFYQSSLMLILATRGIKCTGWVMLKRTVVSIFSALLR